MSEVMKTFSKAGLEAKDTAIADAKRISEFIVDQKKEIHTRRAHLLKERQLEKER